MSQPSENTRGDRLVAFICHASEDEDLARRIATDFHTAGIETFFDEWDITAGQSVRARIDEGLTASTHVVVLLTEQSLAKPWVNAEIDAAFVRKVAGQGALIPVRYQFPIHRLPPLLAALRSPEIVDYARDIHTLIEDIKGVSRRPPVVASAERTLRGAAVRAYHRSRHGLQNFSRGFRRAVVPRADPAWRLLSCSV